MQAWETAMELRATVISLSSMVVEKQVRARRRVMPGQRVEACGILMQRLQATTPTKL